MAESSTSNHIYGQLLLIMVPSMFLIIGWFFRRLINNLDQAHKERYEKYDRHDKANEQQVALLATKVEIANKEFNERLLKNQETLTDIASSSNERLASIESKLDVYTHLGVMPARKQEGN